MHTRFTLLAAALIFFFAVCAISIAARETAVPAADQPVPRLPWLHEGLALTYTWYAAVAPGNGSYYEEDDHGDMILHSTGQRYSRSTQTGTSGSGWTQITVTCIEGDKVVLELSSYANAGSLGKNAPVPQGNSSSVAALMDPGDYWMDPAKLASLHTAPAEHILVSRVAWKAGDNTVDGIRVQVVNGSTYSDHIYDAKTGLCVHVASSSQGAAPKLVGPGDFGRGEATITNSLPIGLRRSAGSTIEAQSLLTVRCRPFQTFSRSTSKPQRTAATGRNSRRLQLNVHKALPIFRPRNPNWHSATVSSTDCGRARRLSRNSGRARFSTKIP
jgi:hypothetical protein